MKDRLLFAQPIVDGAAPLQAGTLRFWAPIAHDHEPFFGLVVKVAYRFEEGATTLVDAPPPGLDVESDLPGAAPGELACASDFVPWKPGVDVLVTGHAHAAIPASRLDAAFAVGPLRREIALVASAPTPSLPLSSAYLREPDGAPAADPTGPARPMDASMWVPRDLEPEAHASATPRQQLGELPSGARLELVGLSARAARLAFELPRRAPRAALVDRIGERTELSLSCDTVWIDTDTELVVLTYRGSLAATPEVEEALGGHLEIWLDDEVSPLSDAARASAFQRALWSHPTTFDDAAAGEPPPPVSPERLAAARTAALGPSPSATVTLDTFAALTAELQEKREPRGDTLLRHGLDEHTWGLEERAYMEWMAAAAVRGDALPAKQFGDRFLAAQQALAGPEEAARGASEYVPIKAAMEAGADPTKVLAAHEMTLPVWMRLDRRFTRAMAEDPALAADIERRVAAAEIDPRLLDDEAALPPLPDDDDDEDEA